MRAEAAFVQGRFADAQIELCLLYTSYKAYIRRKDLGLIAGEYSKKVYLVAEDPGKEPVQQISEDIAQYVAQKNCPYEMCIRDRPMTDVRQR